MNEEIYRDVALIAFASMYLLGVFYILAGEHINETDYISGSMCSLAGIFMIIFSVRKCVSLADKIFSVNQIVAFLAMVYGILVFRFFLKKVIVFFDKNKDEAETLDNVFIKQNPL